MKEIYQLHHKNIAEVASKSTKDSTVIAQEIYLGERMRGKHPVNEDVYITAIAQSIDNVRNGVELDTLGIDFPHTGLETDPICIACRECPTMKNREDVEEMYKSIIKR